MTEALQIARLRRLHGLTHHQAAHLIRWVFGEVLQ